MIISLDALLRKEPFKIALPTRRIEGRGRGGRITPRKSTMQWEYLSQDDFLAQWDPSGHYIYSREDWQDDYIPVEDNASDVATHVGEQGKKQNKKKQVAEKPYHLQRRAFPLQKMIHKKRVSHLCTNPLNFQIKRTASNKENKERLLKYKEYWTDSSMETAKFKLISEAGKVGDGAIYLYIKDNEIKFRTFSYSDGDILYEHRNRRGERIAFARQYQNTFINDKGEEQTETFVDVWTNMEFYTLDSDGNIAKEIDDNGNPVDVYIAHNLGFIPIAYLRLEGPFWEQVQDLIDDFEFLMSLIGEYNTRQAFQMLLIKTNSGKINIKRNGLGGTSIIHIGQDDDASFLGKTDTSNSLATELDNIYSGILDGSGVVPPMQSSSGDRPTGTTAMYYEPEMEWARNDAQYMNETINELANIFKYFVGVLEGDPTGYNALRINATIEPYSYIDFTEWNNTLISLVQAGIISSQTGREKSDFSANDEEKRVEEEQKAANELEARLNEAQQVEENLNDVN